MSSGQLTVLGTIAILDLADQARLLEFDDATARLRETTFYIDASFLKRILSGVRSRRKR